MEKHMLWREPAGSSEPVFLSASGVIEVALLNSCDHRWSRITTAWGRFWYYPGTPEEAVTYLDRHSSIEAKLAAGGTMAPTASAGGGRLGLVGDFDTALQGRLGSGT